MKRIVITGGPGSGKSSLLEVLKALGFSCQEEVSRKVIMDFREQDLSPWGNLSEFIRFVYERIFSDLQQPIAEVTFCDRGMPDCVAYLREAGLPVPGYLEHFDPHAYYSREVFILPPWPEIYRQEPARLQDFTKAESLYQSLKNTYMECGFQLVEVPRLSLKERVDFIFEHLKLRQPAWEKTLVK